MKRRIAIKRQKMIVGVVLGVGVVLLAVVIALSLNGNRAVDESVFKPGDNRLVVSMNAEVASFEDGEYEPEITRIVYSHNGKDITGVKIYFEYQTEEEARTANEKITLDGKDWAENKELTGRFIVFDAKLNQYAGLSVEQMSKTIDNMRAAGNLLEEDDTETVEEPVEETVEEMVEAPIEETVE